MMDNDQIDIFVIGDVVEAEVAALFQNMAFTDRPDQAMPIFYQQAAENIIREKILREPIIQAKLNLGYHTGVYYDQTERIAFMVFNGLFGGFPHSKLFMNVREKVWRIMLLAVSIRFVGICRSKRGSMVKPR